MDEPEPESFTLTAADGVELAVYRWLPGSDGMRAVIQLEHGASEHAGRYARVAGVLNGAGYGVYADDHRGHGRTAGHLERFGLAGHGAWDKMVDDARMLTAHIAAAHPGTPIVLLGHSMGSFIVQSYLLRWGDPLRAAVLTGTGGAFTPETQAEADEFAALLDQAIAAEGRDVASSVFAGRFASYNEPFEASAPGPPTGFEWLSRDPVEVQRYVDDPWCGLPLSNGFVADMTAARKLLSHAEGPAADARRLPVLLMSGDQDPVGGVEAERVRLLGERYRACGMEVTERIYPGARHELFNETNRDEVHRDLLSWLDAVLR